MEAESQSPETNFFCNGIIPARNFRFVLARNTPVVREVAGFHRSPPALAALLGEALLAAFFLSTYSIKKEEEMVSLQLECEGPAGGLVVFAGPDGMMRGCPFRPQADWKEGTARGKGGGVLTVNRWSGDKRKVYASAVEMRDLPLERNIEEFMSRSDQNIGFCRLKSVFNAEELVDVSGFLFQALPGATPADSMRIFELIQEKTPTDFLSQVLAMPSGRQQEVKSLWGYGVRIRRAGRFAHYCDCNREKLEAVIFLLGRAEAERILNLEGRIEAFCDFCKERYLFSADETRDIFRRHPKE